MVLGRVLFGIEQDLTKGIEPGWTPCHLRGVMRVTLPLFFLLGLLQVARADVTLAALFQDRMVLQRGRPVPIWGRAEPEEKVTVSFGQQEVSTTTPADGRWILYLDALETQANPTEMVVTGKNRVVIADVLVGEVWLASGQSNMEWSLQRAERGAEEVAAADYPLIRMFKVEQAVSETPTDTMKGAWQTTHPSQAGGFSAVGYFFARDLYRKLGVPIGVIHSSWGGTGVEAWMSPAALASDPAFAVVNERWKKNLEEYPARMESYMTQLEAWTAEQAAAKASGQPFNQRRPAAPDGPGSKRTPTGLFNAMINPVLPYALRGVIWYQGENNADRATEYHALFASMITFWRAHFGQGDFPFFWVQLANFNAGHPQGTHWAVLREAQSKALALPDTGQAVAIDIGDPVDIHPRNKQEVGRRLAMIAKAQVYGIPGDFSGPVFASAEKERNGMRVRFEHAVTGLIARDRPLQSFEVAGADRIFRPARAVIDGDTVVVSSPEVRDPVAVRYAWSNAPVANLYNGAGLPAAPFRSDDW